MRKAIKNMLFNYTETSSMFVDLLHMEEMLKKGNIMNLLTEPIITENYTAVFIQDTNFGGTVSFQKYDGSRTAQAQWAVLQQDGMTWIVLSYNGKLELLRAPGVEFHQKLGELPVF